MFYRRDELESVFAILKLERARYLLRADTSRVRYLFSGGQSANFADDQKFMKFARQSEYPACVGEVNAYVN